MCGRINRITRIAALTMLALVCSLVACDQASNTTSNKSLAAPLLLEIRADHSKDACLKGGESVPIHLTVTNTGQQPYAIDAGDMPVLDLLIEDSPSMKTVFSWATQNPSQVQHRIVWQPGQSVSIDLDWHVPQKDYFEETALITGLVDAKSRFGQQVGVDLCLGTHLHQ